MGDARIGRSARWPCRRISLKTATVTSAAENVPADGQDALLCPRAGAYGQPGEEELQAAALMSQARTAARVPRGPDA